MKIDDVRIWRLQGLREPSRGFVGWIQCNASQIFDKSPPRWPRVPAVWRRDKIPYEALYVEILTDSGPTGIYGPIDTEAAIVVERQLKRALVGLDPSPVEEIWERMLRLNRHSRAGHFMMGISAVDNALWDLRGRRRGMPVSRLLTTRPRRIVEVYGSCLGFSVRPDLVRKQCQAVARMGFKRQKWFFGFGPAKGKEGMRLNLELARVLRATLGPKTDLMFDAFLGWEPEYAEGWARQAERYRPRWLEEPFLPARADQYATLARATSIPLACGEHLYNRWEVERFLEVGAAKVIQADPEWCGGVSELIEICKVAKSYGGLVIPHGHNLHAALHVVASQSESLCPFGEYLLNKMDHNYHFEKHPPRARQGHVRLSGRPGFGIEFDPSRILSRTLFTCP